MLLNDLMGWPSGSLDCLLFVRQLGPGENFGVKENIFLMRSKNLSFQSAKYSLHVCFQRLPTSRRPAVEYLPPGLGLCFLAHRPLAPDYQLQWVTV